MSRLSLTAAQWAALAVAAALGLAMFALVDLEPEVEAQFFFSTDDPQFRATREIQETFGGGQPVFIAVRPAQLVSHDALMRIRDLGEELVAVEGVEDVRSITHGPEDPAKVAERDPAEVFEDLLDSEFWTDLLLSPERDTTFIVLRLDEQRWEAGVRGIDRVLEDFRSEDFELDATGVPYVAEHIRRDLNADLQLFGIAALLVFGPLLTALLFRSVPVVVGTMAAALAATFSTFLVRAAFGMETNVLTPNLWTIAFVLTLSHVVYLVANHRHAMADSSEGEGGGTGHGADRQDGKADASPDREAETSGADSVREAVRLTGPASLWSLLANVLGFGSLIFVSAKPLREFGISGAIAALCAIAFAYGMFPVFLRSVRPPDEPGALTRALERFFTTRHAWIGGALVVVALVLAPMSWHVNTDPTLASYFAEDGRIRRGLERADRSGGSSPLDIVVADAGGGSLADDDAYERLRALHGDLEADPAVGTVLSAAHLMREIDRQWYSFVIPWETGLDRLDDPKHGRVGRTFFDEGRTRARFLLRMREVTREEDAGPRGSSVTAEASEPSRAAVVSRLEEVARRHGFEPVLTGGLYTLQGEMSQLVRSSVLRGLGGLLVAFLVIVLITSRSLRAALAMGACLALIPLTLFGLVGLLAIPLDIIAAPAANVALPMGIDEMIHLGHWLRREKRDGDVGWAAWRRALARMWYPILASVLIVASGFALFLLSRFPPTQRLGMLVCIGAVLTDLVVLIVLPWLATIGKAND